MKQKRLKLYALANEFTLPAADKPIYMKFGQQKGHRIDLMTIRASGEIRTGCYPVDTKGQ